MAKYREKPVLIDAVPYEEGMEDGFDKMFEEMYERVDT